MLASAGEGPLVVVSPFSQRWQAFTELFALVLHKPEVWILCAPQCPSLDPETSGLGLTEQQYISHGLASQRQCSLRQRWTTNVPCVLIKVGNLHVSDALPIKSAGLGCIGVGHFHCSGCDKDSRVWVTCLSSSPLANYIGTSQSFFRRQSRHFSSRSYM